MRIDGADVDPVAVDAGTLVETGLQHQIEVQIDAGVLIFELQQAGVEVTKDTIVEFCSRDAKDVRARAAYLCIARQLVSTKKQVGLLFRLFGFRMSTAKPSTPKWIWTESLNVRPHAEMIVFSGIAMGT